MTSKTTLRDSLNADAAAAEPRAICPLHVCDADSRVCNRLEYDHQLCAPTVYAITSPWPAARPAAGEPATAWVSSDERLVTREHAVAEIADLFGCSQTTVDDDALDIEDYRRVTLDGVELHPLGAGDRFENRARRVAAIERELETVGQQNHNLRIANDGHLDRQTEAETARDQALGRVRELQQLATIHTGLVTELEAENATLRRATLRVDLTYQEYLDLVPDAALGQQLAGGSLGPQDEIQPRQGTTTPPRSST